MAQVTDQTAPETGGRVLLAVADHFTTTDPTAVLDPRSLMVCIGTEAYRLSGGGLDGDGPAMSRAAVTAAPAIRAGITRGEYALLLRAAVTESGHEWTEDDNQRAIPTVPGPRPAPAEPKRTLVPAPRPTTGRD